MTMTFMTMTFPVPRVQLFGIGALVVLAVLCQTGPTEAREPTTILAAKPVVGTSSAEMTAISQTNAARARHGLPPLAVDSQLMNGARNHARWMASRNSLQHGSGVAENIAMGQSSASEAVSDWMNSPGHRANILGSGYTRIGISLAYSSSGTAYWCQQFR